MISAFCNNDYLASEPFWSGVIWQEQDPIENGGPKFGWMVTQAIYKYVGVVVPEYIQKSSEQIKLWQSSW